MTLCQVSADRRPAFTVLKVSGEVDLTTVAIFRTAVEEALDGAPPRLLFDLTDLRFIDSQGLQVILNTYRRLGADDRVAVCGLTAHLQKLFTMLGITGRVATYPTVDDALTHVRQ
jgi:anti-sigma B factor antagonist